MQICMNTEYNHQTHAGFTMAGIGKVPPAGAVLAGVATGTVPGDSSSSHWRSNGTND